MSNRKHRLRRLSFIAAMVAAICAFAATPAFAAVTTGEATAINEHGVTLHGTAEVNGTTLYWFEYGTTTKYDGVSVFRKAAGASVQTPIEGLQPNTTYHYRLAQYSYGANKESFGSDKTFTTEAKHAPRIEAESYPLEFASYLDNAAVTIRWANIKCAYSWVQGELASAAAELPLTEWEFDECTTKGFFGETLSAEVVPNSCYFRPGVLNSGPPYSGDLDVVCSKGGDGIEVKLFFSPVKLWCTWKIGAQSGATGVGLANVGALEQRAVKFTLGASLSYTRIQGPESSCGPLTGSAALGGETSEANETAGPIGFFLDGAA